MLERPKSRLGQLSAEAKNDSSNGDFSCFVAFSWHVCLRRWCTGLNSTPPLCLILFPCLATTPLSSSLPLSCAFNLQRMHRPDRDEQPRETSEGNNSHCSIQPTLTAPLTLLHPTELTLSAPLTLLPLNSHCSANTITDSLVC